MSYTKSRDQYRTFTKPAELHKAINTLRGIVAGISCSEGVCSLEMQELVHWCSIHAHLKERHPFSELLPVIEKAMEDGFIDEEEQNDILWLCNNFVDEGKYYDVITSSIQFLGGLIHGIMSDGQLSNTEIKALNLWLKSNDFLRGTYPFDELTAMLHSILEDGIITEDERNSLLAFMSNLVEFKDSYNLSEFEFAALRDKYSIGGVCAHNPVIVVSQHNFCFTGESYRSPRTIWLSATVVTPVGLIPATAVKSNLRWICARSAPKYRSSTRSICGARSMPWMQTLLNKEGGIDKWNK